MTFKALIIATIFTVVYFKPSTSHKPVYVGMAKALKIKSSKISPAVAAFEDIYDRVDLNTEEPAEELPQSELNLTTEKPTNIAFERLIRNQISKYSDNYSVSGTVEYEPLNGISIAAAPVSPVVIDDEIETKEETVAIAAAAIVETSSGKPIIISANRPQENKNNNKSLVKPERKKKQIEPSPIQEESSDDNDFVIATDKVLVTGEFKLPKSVLFDNSSMHYVAYWRRLGETISYAEVDPKEQSFEIQVDELDGEVVIELWNQDSAVVARAHVELKGDLKKIYSELSPVEKQLSVSYISSQSTNIKKVITLPDSVENWFTQKSLIDKENSKINLSQYESLSDVTLLAKQKGHWNSLQTITTNRRHEFLLYTDSQVNALYGFALGSLKDIDVESYGVILGRVVGEQGPASGAKVEITDPSAKVVYFSEFLPDTSKKQTSENGRFAILMLRPGAHAIRVENQSGESVEKVVFADAKAITSTGIRLNAGKALNINALAFNKENELGYAQAQVVGSSFKSSVRRGQGEVILPRTYDKVEVDIFDQSNHPTFRVRAAASSQKVNMYQLTNLELAQLKLAARLPNKGVSAIGYSYQDFVVQVNAESDKYKVVYFDDNLEMTQSGVAGGGFVVLGSVGELINIEMQLENGQIYSEAFWSGEDFINLLVPQL